ncbi:MAG: hypothetical protein HQL80_08040 [Magnetococcales bacterium]|nr:hypothetical protein [Magnetococcales bacterium]
MEELKQALSRLDSDELRRIWWENDRETWSEEAFVVARHLLQERGEPIPRQLAKPPEKPRVQKRKIGPFVFSYLFGGMFSLLVQHTFPELTGLNYSLGMLVSISIAIVGASAFYKGWQQFSDWWYRGR